MKRTLKTMMIALCCAASCFTMAMADNDKPISVKTLPVKAQTVLNTYFKSQTVLLATVEAGILNKSYDVVLQNGTKVEFDQKGKVTEIDCKQGAVPAYFIPQAIKNYLNKNYSGQSVKKIEFKTKEYEVELTNGVDLTFNNKFQVTDID